MLKISCTYAILLHIRKENRHIMDVLGQLYSEEGEREGGEGGEGET